jgi:hypothetical protein
LWWQIKGLKTENINQQNQYRTPSSNRRLKDTLFHYV